MGHRSLPLVITQIEVDRLVDVPTPTCILVAAEWIRRYVHPHARRVALPRQLVQVYIVCRMLKRVLAARCSS
jgi:hypothetical protein